MREAYEEDRLTTNEKRALMKLRWAVDQFRKATPKITANHISAFLAVAERPGYGPTEYGVVLGAPQPEASRWLLDMGPKRRDRPGRGLLDRRGHPESLRKVRYYLTDEGYELASEICAAMVGRDRHTT